MKQKKYYWRRSFSQLKNRASFLAALTSNDARDHGFVYRGRACTS